MAQQKTSFIQKIKKHKVAILSGALVLVIIENKALRKDNEKLTKERDTLYASIDNTVDMIDHVLMNEGYPRSMR